MVIVQFDTQKLALPVLAVPLWTHSNEKTEMLFSQQFYVLHKVDVNK